MFKDVRYVDVNIAVERCVDDVDFTVREEDATTFELVATARIDVAAGSSRGNPGFTAGRGFSPAGGAPGGG
ncbi:hypothetical protein F511_37565 [Dorcoceras hygrometricum]|uniref:Uncharacterized protein n=1 Tax=Dorcoceras hygrometricum TaxID=472368 RepID=A0A2Z7D6H4_9LAMI|nr:hypothetical protein F511_37565 [Dorcoceras hygrometricum]